MGVGLGWGWGVGVGGWGGGVGGGGVHWLYMDVKSIPINVPYIILI